MGDNESSQSLLEGVRFLDEGGMSRSDLLVKGVLAAGAAYGLGAIGPYVRGALAADKPSEVDVLNFLLSFEYLQASLYNRGNSEINDKGEKLPLKEPEKELVETILGEEGEHVKAMQEQIEDLGGKPEKKGEYAFSFRIWEQFLTLASELEGIAIRAYNGAIPSLKSQEARELACSVVQVEGRHAASVLIQNKQEPAPEAFDPGDSEVNSINAVVRFTGVYPEL